MPAILIVAAPAAIIAAAILLASLPLEIAAAAAPVLRVICGPSTAISVEIGARLTDAAALAAVEACLTSIILRARELRLVAGAPIAAVAVCLRPRLLPVVGALAIALALIGLARRTLGTGSALAAAVAAIAARFAVGSAIGSVVVILGIGGRRQHGGRAEQCDQNGNTHSQSPVRGQGAGVIMGGLCILRDEPVLNWRVSNAKAFTVQAAA